MAGDMVDELVVGVRYALDTASEKKALGSLAVVEEEIAAISSPGIWAGLGIGIAAGIAGLAALATEAVVAADAAHDMGVRMNLSAEEVQTMGYVAERSSTNLETLGIAYTTLSRQLSSNSKDVQDAWKQLELDPTNYENGTQAIGDVADALNGLESDADRTRIGLLLLGESGPKLKEYLSLGSEGIADLEAHAKALGFVISDADAELSGHLLDSVDDLGKIASGVGRKIGLALVPALDEAASSTVDWYVANQDVIDQQLDRVTDGISKGLEYMLTPLGLATTGALAFGLAWGSRGAAKAMGLALAQAVPLAGTLGSMGLSVGSTALAMGPYAAAAVVAGLALDDLNKAADGADSVTLRLAKTMGLEGKTQTALHDFRDSIKEVGSLAWDLGAAISTGIGDALDKISEQFPNLKPYLDQISEILHMTGGETLDAISQASSEVVAGGRGLRYQISQGDYAGAFHAAFGPGYQAPDPNDPNYRPGFGYTGAPMVNANVTVNAATSPAEIARIAGQEVERQVLEAGGVIQGQP